MKVVHEIWRRCQVAGSGDGLTGADGKNRRWRVELTIAEMPPKDDGSDLAAKPESDTLYIEGDGDQVIEMLRAALLLAQGTRQMLISKGKLEQVGEGPQQDNG